MKFSSFESILASLSSPATENKSRAEKTSQGWMEKLSFKSKAIMNFQSETSAKKKVS